MAGVVSLEASKELQKWLALCWCSGASRSRRYRNPGIAHGPRCERDIRSLDKGNYTAEEVVVDNVLAYSINDRTEVRGLSEVSSFPLPQP